MSNPFVAEISKIQRKVSVVIVSKYLFPDKIIMSVIRNIDQLLTGSKDINICLTGTRQKIVKQADRHGINQICLRGFLFGKQLF